MEDEVYSVGRDRELGEVEELKEIEAIMYTRV